MAKEPKQTLHYLLHINLMKASVFGPKLIPYTGQILQFNDKLYELLA